MDINVRSYYNHNNFHILVFLVLQNCIEQIKVTNTLCHRSYSSKLHNLNFYNVLYYLYHFHAELKQVWQFHTDPNLDLDSDNLKMLFWIPCCS